MPNNSILSKIEYLLATAKGKKASQEDIVQIVSLAKEHTDDAIVGRFFGYSVSDYAIATLSWVGTEDAHQHFKQIYERLPKDRKEDVEELIERHIYQEI